MYESQAPAVPTASDLATLNPVVATVFLAVVGLAVFGFYFGDAIKNRFSPKPQAPPQQVTTGSSLPQVLPAAMDRADVMTDQYIADLRQQIADQNREIAQKDREIARLNDYLRDPPRDQWRRGDP